MAPIDSRWRPALTVFCSLSSRISKATEALVEEVLGLVAQPAGVRLSVSITWPACCSAARTTSVRCTIRSARSPGRFEQLVGLVVGLGHANPGAP